MSYRNITMLISACSVPVYIIIVVAFLFVQCQGASGDDKSINSIASRRSLPDLFLDAIGRNVELGMSKPDLLKTRKSVIPIPGAQVAGANNVSLLEVLQEDGPPRSLDASDPVTVVAIINKSQQVVVYRIMNGKLISVSCALKVEEAGVLPTRFCSPLTNLLQHGVRKVLDTPYDGGVEKVPAILHQGEQVSVIALWRSRKSSLGVRRPEEIAISVLFTEECNSMPLRDYNSIKDTELFSVFEKRLSQCRK